MPEAPIQVQHQQSALPERTSYQPQGRRSAEEDGAWVRLYAAVLQGEPSAAEEVIKALDADPKSKHFRLALYTQAKTALRKRKAIDARNQRIASFLRLALTIVVLGPIRSLRSLLSNGGGVAVEMLPPANWEPARARASALKKDPDFARSKQRFDAGAEGAPPAAAAAEESRGAKAA
jgi:hypothetical protein